ncbi:MAG: prolyl oligopeptidase family serine peptidase [Thermoanaerobaculia bacterium]|nr:prolyl oligopeptidase family serine peptidase [Thermoanaerobaculia bacterium]
MRIPPLCPVLWVGLFAGALSCTNYQETSLPVATRRVDAVDTYYGQRVPDPYKWLEEMESEEVKEWARLQDRHARREVESLPTHAAIAERLRVLNGFKRVGDVVQRAGTRLFLEGGSGRAQPALLARDTASHRATVLFDPLEADPTGELAIADYSLDPSGTRVAVALVEGPSRQFDWIFLDARTGDRLPDRLTDARIGTGRSAARNPWSDDGESFFYTRPLEAGAGRSQLLCHRFGTSQQEDVVFFERPDLPGLRFDGLVSTDGSQLVIHQWGESIGGEAVVAMDPRSASSVVRHVTGKVAGKLSYLGGRGAQFWFMTDEDAPRKRIVRIDLGVAGSGTRQEIVPESADTLAQAYLFGDRLVLAYLREARNVLQIRSLEGELQFEIELPDGLIFGYSLRYWAGITGSPFEDVVFVRSLGPTSAGSIYQVDLTSGELSIAERSGTPFDMEGFTTEQVHFESDDGTRVPMFLVHRKELSRDQTYPTLLWVYGAYGFTAQPYLNTFNSAWLEMGGILAMPNIRGGGVYGEAWRIAGSRAAKIHSVQDTIAAAQWLVAQGYTSPERLAVFGNSAGATAAGGAMALRPKLFGAGIYEVPVADLLGASRFKGGKDWLDTFGTPDNEAEYRAMRSYSPYQNIDPNSCPIPSFIAAGDQDVTAVPMHAYKLTAALQWATRSCAEDPPPVLLRMDWGTDHGANKPVPNRLAEQAAELAFLSEVLGAPIPYDLWGARAPSAPDGS